MSKVETARWILAVVCFVPAAFFIIMNWVIFRFNWKNRGTGQSSSWVPVLGGLLGSLSIWLVPLAQVKPFWWIPFVIDYGCLIGLTHTAIYWAQYWRVQGKRS